MLFKKSLVVTAICCVFVHPLKAAPLSKTDALKILKEGGYKWNLTKTLEPEAESKLAEVQSETKPQFQFAMRQYAARINPIQFGGTEPETISTVGFGTTALEMKWAILDTLTDMKILSAEANYKMNSAQAKHYQNELMALMLIQYLNVQRLQKQLEVNEANIVKSKLILKLVEIKRSVGAGIPLEIARAKNLLQLDQMKKMATQVKYSKARTELATTLGQDHLDRELPVIEPRIIHISNSQKILEYSLSQRADLKAAESGLDAAEKANEASSKILFPKLDLLTEVGSTQATLAGMPVKTMNGFIGIALSIPFETGGFIQAKRRETAILKQKANLHVHEVRADITSQVHDAIEQLEAAEKALQASADYLKTAEEESSLSDKKYASGSSTILDVTNGHTNLANAHDLRVEQIFNYEAAKVGYFRAIGDFEQYFASEKD